MTHKITKTLSVINEKGLHARASAKFVETVEKYDASANVIKDGLDACGDSIMGLLMLAASRGTTIDVETEGPQARELAEALEKLVKNRFDEAC